MRGFAFGICNSLITLRPLRGVQEAVDRLK
jgi:hypothetical protein